MSPGRYVLLLFLILVTCYCYPQVIPASRSTDWSLAGYPGDLPVYNTVKDITDYGGVADGKSLNELALQRAITSLNGQNGVVYFPAGTYLFHAPITLRSGLVLRGEGASGTMLLFDLGGQNNLITMEGISTSVMANLTASVLKDNTSLVVDDPSLFQPNDYVKIYQNDSALVNDLSVIGAVGQIIQVNNITGNTIHFSNSLRKNYLLADAPKIKKLNMVTGVGIECLKIKRMDATGPLRSNLLFLNTAKCWLKGVESDSCNFAHVRIDNSTNIEITGCYFHGAFSYGATGEGYGISCQYTSGECLIENNIFRHLRHSMLVQYGANGNVFDYNYSLAPFKSESFPYDLSGDIVIHGNYPYLNLFEGNIVQNIIVDVSNGKNGPFNTFFRNRAEDYGIIVSAGSGDSLNVAGNEITGTGLNKGNYFLRGNGNLEYGNNVNNFILPAGTTTISDKSYIHNDIPAFWNISSLWPSIGIPNILGSGAIPAKARYVAGTGLAGCFSTAPLIYTFTGNGNWNISANWRDNKIPPSLLSIGSEIIIDPPAGAACILNIPYTVSKGAKIRVAAGKNFTVQGNLTLESDQ